jgi:hypothetical protein
MLIQKKKIALYGFPNFCVLSMRAWDARVGHADRVVSDKPRAKKTETRRPTKNKWAINAVL